MRTLQPIDWATLHWQWLAPTIVAWIAFAVTAGWYLRESSRLTALIGQLNPSFGGALRRSGSRTGLIRVTWGSSGMPHPDDPDFHAALHRTRWASVACLVAFVAAIIFTGMLDAK